MSIKKWKKTGRGFLLALLLAAVWAQTVCASGRDTYTYQVTFLPGDKGTFTDQVRVSCPDAAQYTVASTGIVIKNLQYNDRVSITFAEEDIKLKDEKYYARGVRRSGQDNSAMEASFAVKHDEEYLVAYGVAGDTVKYTVKYQDRSGNTLHPDKTYRGNVGDKPVAGYIYIAGYQPQAYNLTKTLSANEAENIFTFVYTRIPTGGTSGGGGGTGGGGGGSTGGGGTTAPAPAPAPDPAAPQAPGTTVTVPGGGTAGTGGGTAGNLPEEAGEAQGDAGEADNAEAPEETRESIDLDDEAVPLAPEIDTDTDSSGVSGTVKYLPLYIGVSAAAVAGLVLLFFYLRRRRKKEE